MSAYSDLVLAASPVGYWRLGEASGTNAADATGGTDGTYVGSPTLGEASLTTGDANTSVLFNGSTQYVSIGNISADPVHGIEFWFKNAVDWDKDTTGRLAVQCDGGFFGVYIGQAAGSIANEVITVVDGGGNRSYWADASASTIPAGIHHCFCNWNGSEWDIYLDGDKKSISTTGTPEAFHGASVQIARRTGDSSLRFGGTLDEVALYGSALTEAQILSHYTLGLNGPGTTLLLLGVG